MHTRITACIPSLVVVFLLVTAAWAQNDSLTTSTCSNATLKGNFGALLSGFGSNSVLASGGQLTADGKGGFRGTWAFNVNGNIATNVPVTGTYAVGKGCAGHATLQPQGGSQFHLNLIVDSGGKRLELIVTDSGIIEAGYALAQGNATCSLAGVKGTWGWLQTEAFLIGVGPGAFIGQTTLDGSGKLQAKNVTESIDGQIVTGLSGPGTYTMESNCIGTLTIPGQGQGYGAMLVVVNGGKEMLAVGLSPNTVNIQSAIRQ
jgi:hypothetical protein